VTSETNPLLEPNVDLQVNKAILVLNKEIRGAGEVLGKKSEERAKKKLDEKRQGTACQKQCLKSNIAGPGEMDSQAKKNQKLMDGHQRILRRKIRISRGRV